jgi:type III restriction enzyme
VFSAPRVKPPLALSDGQWQIEVEGMDFKTVKPVQATQASHLNFVAADTGSWEQAAATQLETAAQQGLVQCYVRNDRLELTIPYEFYGQPRTYEPDFVVRMADGSHLLLEIKGPVPAEVAAKHEAAARWVAAVNRWGQLGRWRFVPCHDPQRLMEHLREMRTE